MKNKILMTIGLFLAVKLIINIKCEDKLHKKPNAVIHVGSYKTGTTWFQRLIFVNFISQLENENYYRLVPSQEEEKSRSNKDISACLCTNMMERDNCIDIFYLYNHHLKYHLSLNHSIYLSSEVLSCSLLDFPNFFGLLEGFKVSIIVVYRDYVHQFISIHNQRYKMGKTEHNFPNFLRNCLYIEECQHFHLSAVELVKMYSKHIDVNNIKIYDYNAILSENRDIAALILSNSFPDVSENFRKFVPSKVEKMKFHMHQKNLVLNQHVWLYPMDLCRIGIKNQNRFPKNPFACMTRFVNLTLSLENPPLECISDEDNHKLVYLALDYEKELREKFSNIIINGNSTINVEKIFHNKNLEEICGLNTDVLSNNNTLVNSINSIFDYCD